MRSPCRRQRRLPPAERPCYSTGVGVCRGIWIAGASLVAAVAILGCETHDLGRPCELLLGDQDPAVSPYDDRARTETITAVGQAACLPCDELICVALDGITGYCSKRCIDDSNCPTGFVCRVVIEADPDAAADDDSQQFAGAGFCVWQSCSSDEDCGSPDQLECATIENSDPETELKRCQYIETDTRDVERPACENFE